MAIECFTPKDFRAGTRAIIRPIHRKTGGTSSNVSLSNTDSHATNRTPGTASSGPSVARLVERRPSSWRSAIGESRRATRTNANGISAGVAALPAPRAANASTAAVLVS